MAENTEDVFVRAMSIVQKHLGPVKRFGSHEPLQKLGAEGIEAMRRHWLCVSQLQSYILFFKGARYTGVVSSFDGLLSASLSSKIVGDAGLSWALFRELVCGTQCHFGCATRLSDSDVLRGLPSRSVAFRGRQRQISEGVSLVVAAGVLGRGIPDVYHCMAFGAVYQGLIDPNRLEEVSCETEQCREVRSFRLFGSNTDEAGWDQHKVSALEGLGEGVLWSLDGGKAPALFSERMMPQRAYEVD